ncbi:MAG TPA: hypothetical protein VLD39_01115 [Gammaproteobacteria bacterium]|nr:hypothetical protein [Gammaproteobacteria bacterium]
MNRQDDREMDALERRVAALPRGVMPDTDLWPGIAARLGAPVTIAARRARAVRPLPWLPVAVALAAGYAIASVFPLRLLEPGGPAAPAAAPPALALIDSMRPVLEQLPAKTRSVVEANLSGLENDRLAIEQALAVDPDNVLLQELRMSAQDQAESVVQQVIRLTRPEPPEDYEI